MESRAPSLTEFYECCRREFAFLAREGFAEVALPDVEKTSQFRVTFARNDIRIVITGEGYGTVASTTVYLSNGRRLAPAQLAAGFTPRKGPWRQRAKLSQLEQVREDAALLREHGANLWSKVAT
jgi:hypothetical protein